MNLNFCRCQSRPGFGDGREKSDEWWKALGMQLRVSVEPALLEEVRSLGQNGKSGKQQTYKVVGLTQVRLWFLGRHLAAHFDSREDIHI
jgi:hypothetical protein